MQPEIEAKFLNVDHDLLRVKLKQLGATCEQPMRLMCRRNYDYPDRRLDKIGGWVRVRNEGNKVTLSYKQSDNRTLHGTQEISLIVNSFDEACKLLETIGLVEKTYQETKRESWILGDVQIELDEWPWVQPFVEIEGPGEASLRNVADQLGLAWNRVMHGSVASAYQAEYDVTEGETESWPEVLFVPVPVWLKQKRRTKTKADT